MSNERESAYVELVTFAKAVLEFGLSPTIKDMGRAALQKARAAHGPSNSTSEEIIARLEPWLASRQKHSQIEKDLTDLIASWREQRAWIASVIDL
jgi:hypothetical protein